MRERMNGSKGSGENSYKQRLSGVAIEDGQD
jgi:hypothetical protein